MSAPFALTTRQHEVNRILAGPQRNTLVYGGARSGKTFLIVRAIIIRALRFPFSRHVIFRHRANAIRASIWMDTFPKVMRLCFPGVKWSESRMDGYIEFQNGAQIWMAGLDDPARVEKILGMEFATLYFNESSQIPHASYAVARTRLAQVIPGCRQREIVDLNPVGSGHWSYRQFVQKIDPVTRRPLPDPEEYGVATINPEDNRENLSPEFLKALSNMSERQRARFYEGKFIKDIDGALWPADVLERCRVDPEAVPDMARVVVSVDPSGTKGKEEDRSNSVGIIVAGKGMDGRGYVLEDLTVNASPSVWGSIAVQAYHRHRADLIIAEINYGGAMVENVIKTIDSMVPYSTVTATRGKAVRAEPVAALYEDGKAFHVGQFPELEDQMSNFSTAGYLGDRSPDRADALVWALSELMLDMGDAEIWSRIGSRL